MTHESLATSALKAGLAEVVRNLTRCIVVANDKGGVGKTSTASNLAALYANQGYQVLMVDLNRQANLSDDLGYRGSPIDDQGLNLLLAIQLGQPLVAQPVPGRPNLFVVPGGTHLSSLTPVLTNMLAQTGAQALEGLARALAPIAGPYDIILIDTPPENPMLVDLALRAARWLLMPTRSDGGGLVGMKLLAERFVMAKAQNPALALLGVLLFGTGRGSTAIHREVRKDVEEAFGSAGSPMLATVIGYGEAIARATRKRGRVAHELVEIAKEQPDRFAALRRKKDGEDEDDTASDGLPMIPLATAEAVANDFNKLSVEVFQILAQAEQAS
ncbi:hypothetical protein GCM10027589_04560 [Actinocorallia lasiicapitis]